MTHEFPADVVKTTDKFATELGQFNGVNIDDIAQLWKAYTTQNTVVQDGVVSRLENLFWRIWGNVTLQQSLTGITLATLFMAIHENSSLNLTHRHQSVSETVEFPPVTSTAAEAPLIITTISPKSDEEQKELSPKKEPSKNPLPPILKKSNEGKKSQPPTAPSSYKTTRILIPEKPSQRTTKDATKDTSTENEKTTKSVTNTATATATATQKTNRKKATFVANRTTSSRRRGVLIRRKSSQTSPVTSPTVEHSEESLQEQILQETQTQKEEQKGEQKDQQDQLLEKAGAEGPIGAALSWRSLPYLKIDENKTTADEEEAAKSGTSPPPINFSLSSVRHHRSPEDKFQAAYQETTASQVTSSKPLVDQGFRTHFVQRRSAHGTTNNSTASSLTTGLSSTNFRELLNAAEAAAAAMKNTNDDNNDCQSPAGSLPAGPRNLLPKPDATTVTSPTRKSDRNRRPMIVNTKPQVQQVDTELVSRHSPAAVAVSGSVTSTSQHTTSGVFSVPKDSQGQLGEQLSSFIKGVKEARTRRG